MSTEILHRKNIKSLVPELRFKGFKEEWIFKKIGKIAELTSSKRVYLTDYVERGIPFYRGKEITELKLGKIPNDILYITESSYRDFKKKYGVPQKDDLLITAVGTLGNVLRIKDDSEFYFKDGNLIWFRKINEFSPFLEIALNVYKGEIEKTSIGSTQRALTMVELRKLNFPFPTLPEQQKIASFLSSVDEKIQQLSRKKELLEQYKKGVMQQLFSGKLRFKDENGEDYADWEEKKLGEVGKIITGSTPPTSNLEYYIGNRLFVSPADINEARFVLSTKTTLTDLGFEKGRKLKKGAVLFVCIGSTIGKVAIAGYDCITNQQINAIEANSLNCNDFIFSLLELNAGNIKLLAGVQAVPQINKTDFSNFSFMFPSLPEQQKIANFLSNIDVKIENTNQQIYQMQDFKKGLLQQLFV